MLSKLFLSLFSGVVAIGLVAAAPTNAVADDDWDDYWEDYWDDYEDALEDRRDRWDDWRWRAYAPYRYRGYSSGYYYDAPRYYYSPPRYYYSRPYYYGYSRPYYYGGYYSGPRTYGRIGPFRWELWD